MGGEMLTVGLGLELEHRKPETLLLETLKIMVPQ